MVFRSVQLQAPPNMLGWDYGTLDIDPVVKAISLPKELENMRMKIRSTIARGKLHSGTEDGELNQHDGHIVWKTRGETLRLPVRQRYASPLIVEFRKDSALKDRTPAFCILWLKDIPDNKPQTLKLPVWTGDLDRAEHNCLEQCGEKVGEIEITLTFWSGLSGYHSRLAKKDRHLGQVMEALDVCRDQDEMDDWDDSRPTTAGARSTDSSSSSSDDSDYVPDFVKKKTNSNLGEDGKRGVVDQIRDYKHHSKQLHRKNRGLMQWKAPRTVAWIKHLAERGENKVESVFKHKERGGTGIETEV
jgi:hypothetical protein